jgi:hypothetical protein
MGRSQKQAMIGALNTEKLRYDSFFLGMTIRMLNHMRSVLCNS